MSWLRDLRKSRYVSMLEEDNARLRAENRALLNSLLGTVGFPPIDLHEEAKPTLLPRPRRRTWQQFQRAREEEARQ